MGDELLRGLHTTPDIHSTIADHPLDRMGEAVELLLVLRGEGIQQGLDSSVLLHIVERHLGPAIVRPLAAESEEIFHAEHDGRRHLQGWLIEELTRLQLVGCHLQ